MRCQFDFPLCLTVTADNVSRYFANMLLKHHSLACVCVCVCLCSPSGREEELAVTSAQRVKLFNLILTRDGDWWTVGAFSPSST